ncbi:MAG TPA: glycosyltransferase [Bacteroidia bacterium]|jgi:biofilm PGA synthesis N-glycosyltransferase PgaC|nr:glycosyltransferase [Bacteroidia bacterium]HMU20113.1 glycosyltransferase [Bacteroidia bacterium]
MLFLLLSPALYFFLTFRWMIGFNVLANKQLPVNQNKINNFFSIVIAVRNEQANIKRLLNSLAEQNYNKSNFEIIIVDDHSEDETATIAKHLLDLLKLNGAVFSLQNSNGKKAAIAEGVKASKAEVIITTDADCVFNHDWLLTINNEFDFSKPDMLILPVVLQGKGNLSKIQQTESLGLAALTLGSLAIGKPLMCNGANLVFKKNAYLQINNDDLRHDVPSGDDTFFMLSLFAKNKQSIQALASHKVVVTSDALSGLSALINQRVRWASKVKQYKQRYIKTTGLFVAIFSVLQYAAVFGLIILPTVSQLWLVSAVTLATKWICDFIFIQNVSSKLKQKFYPGAFVLMQLLYPVYTFIVGVLSLSNHYQWKGRSYH